MAYKGWVEIWGKEKGKTSVGLLFKIPASSWNDHGPDGIRDIYVRQMKEEGVTELEVRPT